MASVIVAIIATAVAIKKGHAAPTTHDTRSCVQFEVPIKVSLNTTKWLQPRVDNNIDAVNWADDMTTWSSPQNRTIGTVPVSGTFKIAGQLCVPNHGAHSDILQIATHGVGFDSRYWDVQVESNYSYVDAALAEGYSIFTYDRLGTGKSDKPDAYTVVQSDVQHEILRQLTVLARTGKLISSSTSCKPNPNSSISKYVPAKVIHVGHSYGSILSNALLVSDPSLSDGAILTGFLYNAHLTEANVATWGFEFARESDPSRFHDRGSGYITQATKSNVMLSFFHKEAFEPALLDYAEKIKQPNAVTEFVSIGVGLGQPASGFKGPILFFVGEFDYGFCAGDCKGTYDKEGTKKALYPAASKLDVVLQPGTGHGLTLATNATAGYRVMFDFLHGPGL